MSRVRGTSYTILFVLLAGLVLRLVMISWWVPRMEITGDPQQYLGHGREMAASGRYQQNPVVDKMPGMAAIVALGCQLGDSQCLYVPLGLFAAAGVGLAWGCWFLVRDRLRARWRLPALVVLVLGVPETFVFPLRLLPDLPAAALGVFAIVVMISGCREPGMVWRIMLASGVAGFLFGLSLYLRPDMLVTAVALAGVWGLSLRSGNGWGLAITAPSVLLLCTAAVVLPWGFRNAKLTDEFRVTNNLGSRALYWGFNERRDLDWNPTGDEPWVGKPPSESGAIAVREATTWIRSHPFGAASLVAWRVTSHVGLAPQPLISASATQIPWRVIRVPYRLLLVVVQEFWLVLGLLAITVAWRKAPLGLALLTTFAGVRMLIPGGLYPDHGRYALILVPTLATWALWHWGARDELPSRTGRAIAVTMVILLALQSILFLRWGWV